MTLREIEDSIPNGLHDAQVKRIEIDYEKGIAKFLILLWTGDLSSQDETVREAYQEGELIIKDLLYCIIEPPDPSYSYSKAMPITIGASSPIDEPIKTTTPLPKNLPAGAFAYWFFVHEWNSFIHIAAMDASLKLK
jgi:hypothetical protein